MPFVLHCARHAFGPSMAALSSRREAASPTRFAVAFATLAGLTCLVGCDMKGDNKTSAATAPSAAPSNAAINPPGAEPPAATAPPSAPPPEPSAPSIPAPPDVAEAPKDASKSASGLAWKVLTHGSGKIHPTPSDRVKVNYTGWTKDGRMFDSSVTRGEPAAFGVSEVIKGWTEGLQLMVPGEKRRLWIPGALAYGDHPRAGAPGGDLVFDVELLEIVKPPPVPEDVKAAPASATKTPSGLAYKILKPGAGGPTPKPTDTVTVNYSGWTTDGKMFDSSVTRGQPASFPVRGVIKGWTEGLQLMTVGQKSRFWIPGSLAYGDTPTGPGRPFGTLVFDVELLGIR